GELDRVGEFIAKRSDFGQGAVAVANPRIPRVRIEAHVVGVRQIRKIVSYAETVCIESLKRTVVAIGNQDLIDREEIEHTLRLGHAGNALEAFSGAEINYLDGIVPESGDKKPRGFGVNREVIEAACNAGERDGLNECQWVSGASGQGEQ